MNPCEVDLQKLSGTLLSNVHCGVKFVTISNLSFYLSMFSRYIPTYFLSSLQSLICTLFNTIIFTIKNENKNRK